MKTKPTTPEQHKLKIARDTLAMPDAVAGVMGGPLIAGEDRKFWIENDYNKFLGKFTSLEKARRAAKNRSRVDDTAVIAFSVDDWFRYYCGRLVNASTPRFQNRRAK